MSVMPMQLSVGGTLVQVCNPEGGIPLRSVMAGSVDNDCNNQENEFCQTCQFGGNGHAFGDIAVAEVLCAQLSCLNCHPSFDTGVIMQFLQSTCRTVVIRP